MPTFIFEDSHYRDLGDLVLGIRGARAAFEAAQGRIAAWEWESFAREIHRAERAGAPLRTLIDEAESWAAGWWRRANARTHHASPKLAMLHASPYVSEQPKVASDQTAD